jgi:hypothetical protein
MDPLAGLRDWHLPEPVSWWPPAPGWWLAAVLSLALLVLILRLWRVRRSRTAPARAARAELGALRARLADGSDGRQFVAAISVLLRRLALVRFPPDQVAGLAGPQWLAFLDRTGGGGGFTQEPGRLLAEVPYRPAGEGDSPSGDRSATSADLMGLADLADGWIRAHWEPSR